MRGQITLLFLISIITILAISLIIIPIINEYIEVSISKISDKKGDDYEKRNYTIRSVSYYDDDSNNYSRNS